MDLYLLAELKTISLKVTTVDMLKPPADFRYHVNTFMYCMMQLGGSLYCQGLVMIGKAAEK